MTAQEPSASGRPTPPLRFPAIFRPRPDHELYAMGDDDLVAYIAAAKAAGETAHAETATFMFLYKHEDRMRAGIARKLPAHLRHHSDTVGDWVIHRVTEAFLELPVKGESVGEYVNYYKAAIGGRMTDYFRTTQGKTLERQAQLPSEHQGEDGPADTLGEELDVERLLAQVDLDAVTAVALEQISERDRAIVRRAIWDDQPSKVVAQDFDMRPDAVDQVKSRFKSAFRAECRRRGVTGP